MSRTQIVSNVNSVKCINSASINNCIWETIPNIYNTCRKKVWLITTMDPNGPHRTSLVSNVIKKTYDTSSEDGGVILENNKNRRTFDKHSWDLLTVITHSEILVTYSSKDYLLFCCNHISMFSYTANNLPRKQNYQSKLVDDQTSPSHYRKLQKN